MKKIFITIGVVVAAITAVSLCLIKSVPLLEPQHFGVTFSKIQAETLGLDWQKVYLALADDLGFSSLRVPVYWEEAEPKEGEFDFSWLDWMVARAVERNVKLILAIGEKLPRWPECHIPHWVRELPISNQQLQLLKYIEMTVKRYDNNPAVWAWQVENEPFLRFGVCPDYDKDFVDEEIALVRSLSNKPVIMTDGGEFGDWVRSCRRSDIFGPSLYRTAHKEPIGRFTYPLPSWFFRLKRAVVEQFCDSPMFVSELQTEPWLEKPFQEMPIEEQYKSMSPEKFNELLEYIKGSGFDTFYLWGAEWWYWLKEQGHPEMWNIVKEAVSLTK